MPGLLIFSGARMNDSHRKDLKQLKQRIGSVDGAIVDEMYGLELVFEPGGGNATLDSYVEFLCPYCCENVGTSIDLTAGSRSYIEDCQVCCQPYELTIEVDAHGHLSGITAQRTD